MATSLRSRIRRRLFGSRLLREERGSATIWVAAGMLPLVGFAAIAVDVGTIAVAQAKIQRAADAGAHAGVKAMRDGASNAQVLSRARRMVRLNTTALRPDIVAQLGAFDLVSQTFTQGGINGVPAVEIQVEAEIPLVFAPAVGIRSATLSAEAVSGGRRREVVIVQDISGSFAQEIGQARIADQALVQQMSDQGVPGDRVGVVTFGNVSAVQRVLTPLNSGTGAVLSSISAINTCSCGTNTAAGINEAVNLFQGSDPVETERVIIIVTDGQPSSQTAAKSAADAAFNDNGIHIFTILLNNPFSQTASDNNFALKQGIGIAFETSDPDSLDELLLKILGALPILLVS